MAIFARGGLRGKGKGKRKKKKGYRGVALGRLTIRQIGISFYKSMMISYVCRVNKKKS